MSDSQEVVLPDVTTGTGVANAARVILFNDEWHTFEEVINQIIKATKCGIDKAELLTWEVHNIGKSCVFDGDMPECLKVSNILEEISLNTKIEI